MTENQNSKKVTFKAFLSHRYKSPLINTYFYEIFNESAEVQFEIDEGILSTNVTRLERMIRDADAFIGIYSLPSELIQNPTKEFFLKSAKYFRLELELALRSKKPAILFIDKRYGNTLKVPSSIIECRYDHHEIIGSGGSPNRNSFRIEFNRFCEIIIASMNFTDLKKSRSKSFDKVTIILPERVSNDIYYIKEDTDQIINEIEQTSKEAILLKWPPIINEDFMKIIEDSDYAVVEINDPSGIVHFLHGIYTPMLRLCKASINENLTDFSSYKTLFSNQTVGYEKDIIKWDNHSTLFSEIKQRLLTINAPIKRFNTFSEASKYFNSAALRKETIFVSYSGNDEEIAQPLISALKKRFQKVFDYKDSGQSIIPGKSWIEEIFESLSQSNLGILLLSDSYFNSGNCLHEAGEIFAMRDNDKLKLLPIKLYNKELKLPPFMGGTQYLRFWQFDNLELIVKEIENLVDHI